MVKAAHTRLFLDLDGVFFDFETSAIAILKESSKQAEDKGKKIWPILMNHEPSFFANLELMPGADALWLEIREFLERSGQNTPIFLTGCPKYKREKAEEGKEACVKKHFIKGDVHKISIPEDATIDDAIVYQEELNKLLKTAGSNDGILILCRPDQKNFFSLLFPFYWMIVIRPVLSGHSILRVFLFITNQSRLQITIIRRVPLFPKKRLIEALKGYKR